VSHCTWFSFLKNVATRTCNHASFLFLSDNSGLDNRDLGTQAIQLYFEDLHEGFLRVLLIIFYDVLFIRVHPGLKCQPLIVIV
jgi:hypothetical protein